MISLPKSLSVRLLLVFVVSALVILLVLSFLFSYGVSTEWRQQIRPHLAQYANYVRKDLGDPPSLDVADALASSLPVDIHIFKDGTQIHSTSGHTFDSKKFKFAKRPARFSNDRKQQNARGQLNNLEFARNRHDAVVKIPMKEHLVYIELDRKLGSSRYRRAHLFLLPIVLAVLLAFLYGILRRLLSPIGDIKMGVANMAAGNLNHQIPIQRGDDLGQLASSVNGFSSRIQSLLDAKRQLLLSVSHELRSPLTRARLAATMIPESKQQERVLDELKLLDSLIESLIETERLQSEHSVLNLAAVNLSSLLAQCVNDVREEYDEEIDTISLHVSEGKTISVQCDEVRIRLLCRNLINNAVQHGKTVVDDRNPVSKALISVTLSSTAQSATISVIDNGRGVENSELIKLTDAFYRPDPSRAYGSGGVGLGLSLVKLIAEAHGGSLLLEHRKDKLTGLVASVELPNVLATP